MPWLRRQLFRQLRWLQAVTRLPDPTCPSAAPSAPANRSTKPPSWTTRPSPSALACSLSAISAASCLTAPNQAPPASQPQITCSQQKGVATDLIATTLATAYDGLDEAALVREHIARKRLKPPSDDKSTARILRRLTAAGFGSKAIFKVLRELKSGDTADNIAMAEAAHAGDD